MRPASAIYLSWASRSGRRRRAVARWWAVARYGVQCNRLRNRRAEGDLAARAGDRQRRATSRTAWPSRPTGSTCSSPAASGCRAPRRRTSATNLGKVLRLNLDGTPAPGNPFADRGGVSAQIWSYGHRNLLGLEFDGKGRLWDLEHGRPAATSSTWSSPARITAGRSVRTATTTTAHDIPDHTADDGFAKPAISWNPVIAPGDFIFYSGATFPDGRAMRWQSACACRTPGDRPRDRSTARRAPRPSGSTCGMPPARYRAGPRRGDLGAQRRGRR